MTQSITHQQYTVYVFPGGTKTWYQNGKLHRLDGPAIEGANGTKHWYQNGKLHRLDGPACEYANGGKEWWVNGKLHRLDGPAIECVDGTKEWVVNGKLHRLDGPACEYANGDKEGWIEGTRFPNELEFNKAVQNLKKQKTQNSCVTKIIEIDGQKYQLVKVE